MYNIPKTVLRGKNQKGYSHNYETKFSPHKKENFGCAISFLFCRYRKYKKSNSSLKNPNNNGFWNNKNFFHTSDIRKIKTILHSQSSPFYEVKISFLSYDCSLLCYFPRKTVFGILCIYKTDATHAILWRPLICIYKIPGWPIDICF